MYKSNSMLKILANAVGMCNSYPFIYYMLLLRGYILSRPLDNYYTMYPPSNDICQSHQKLSLFGGC